MDSKIHEALYASVLKLLKPLVRVLLNHGVSHSALAEISRRAYVEEGFAYMARSGKRPNISGVAALTGLSRKEVKRLNEAGADTLSAAAQRRNRAIRVLSGWMNDPEFMDAGEPAKLALRGGGASFAALVKRYSGDVIPASMQSLLEASGNIRVEGDSVILEKKAFIPMDTPVDRLNILGTDAGELIETIGHNILAAPEDRLFQRKVSNALVRKDALPQFREFSNRHSQKLLEKYDAWLSRREVEEGSDDEAGYVAVGIYYVEQSDQEMEL